MERIPLFIAALTIIVCGANMLVSDVRPVRKWVIRLAGFYAVCVVVIFAAAFGAKCFWPGSPLAENSAPGQSDENKARN